MMNSTLKKTAWILLFAACMGSATVAGAQSRFSGYGFQAQEDNRRGGDSRRQQSERYEQQRNAERAQQRRNDRLSPDERRTLRQQIDEAGRDIYAPRRR